MNQEPKTAAAPPPITTTTTAATKYHNLLLCFGTFAILCFLEEELPPGRRKREEERWASSRSEHPMLGEKMLVTFRSLARHATTIRNPGRSGPSWLWAKERKQARGCALLH